MTLYRHSGQGLEPAVAAWGPSSGTVLLGFWAAIATAVTYIVFDLGFLLDTVMPVPWDVWIPIGASTLIAPSFLLLTASIHYSAPLERRVWTHSATLFAAIYTALAELVYFTWLFVVEPRVVDGNQAEVELLVFRPSSFVQMVDAAAYTSMGIAALHTAAAFTNRQGRWQRWFAIANGPAALLVLISYITDQVYFGVPAGLLVPAYAISAAVWFHRSSRRLQSDRDN